MGHIPIVPPPRLSADPYRWPASYVAELEGRLHLRGSRFRRRRRRAYAACLELIRWRERQLQPLPVAMGAGAIVPPPKPGKARELTAEEAMHRLMDASALIPPKPSDAARSVQPAYVTGATGVVSSGGSGWMGATGATGPSLEMMGATGHVCTAGMVTGGCGCTVCMPPLASQFPRPRMVEIGSGEEVELVDRTGRRWLVPVAALDPPIGDLPWAPKPLHPPANPSNRKPDPPRDPGKRRRV